MIGIDQDTGTKTKEPLMSLSAYRTGKVGQKQLLRLYAHAVYVCVCVCVCASILKQVKYMYMKEMFHVFVLL